MSRKVTKIKEVKSWSLSALHLYEQCPSKFKKERLEGRPRETSPALERGIDIHAKLENYLNGLITGMPPELKKLETEIKNIKKHDPAVEEEYVFDKNWKPIKGPNAWRDKNAWLRAKLDIRVDDFLVDLKTGRHYPKYIEQAELYSLLTFILHPDITSIDVEFWYTKTGDVVSYTFDRSMIDESIKKWQARVDKLFNEKDWLPTENQYCNWCNFQKECELFNGDK